MSFSRSRSQEVAEQGLEPGQPDSKLVLLAPALHPPHHSSTERLVLGPKPKA